MTDVSARILGLESALAAMMEAFPSDPRRHKSLLNSAMRASAKKTILPIAKQRALAGDSSGALSESIGLRTQSNRKLRLKNMAAGIEVVPIRRSRKALAKYIDFYYTRRGLTAPARLVTKGLGHAHLVEFGSLNNPANPFLYPAGKAGRSAFANSFALHLRKKTEAAVRRARKR